MHTTSDRKRNLKLASGLLGASLLVLLCGAPQLISAQTALYNTFQKLRVPDFVPISSTTQPIQVVINGNVVKPGDSIPARNFRNLDINKHVTWDPSDTETVNTLMLLDLDRKPNPNGTLSVYNQYTTVNIPANHMSFGQNIVAYEPPNVPCQPSTKHRLVVLAFEQDQNIDLGDIAYISSPPGPSPRRENFRLEEFTKRHRLYLKAANVFMALGDVNGVCSGASSLHLHHNFILGPVLFLMVIVHRVLIRH